MSHLDILLPFGLPPAEMAADLLRELKIPAFATLISRAGLRQQRSFDPFARSLPHEIWLAGQLGMDKPEAAGSPPVAIETMKSYGLKPESGTWFILHPVHLHVARDHLVLTRWQQMPLTEDESRQLFDAAKPLFDELDMPLLYGDAHYWFVRGDAWEQLHTATPDAASGHNIDIWLPRGQGERAWRKLQNEVQMTWHAHPVNMEREALRQNAVNGLWLWGGTPADLQPASSPHYQAFSLPGATHPFAHYRSTPLPDATASGLLAAASGQALVILDSLTAPALSSDWAEWLARYQTLEQDWFAPLLEAIKDGRISHVSLIITHGTRLSEFAVSRQSLRKFWVRPTLAKLSQ